MTGMTFLFSPNAKKSTIDVDLFHAYLKKLFHGEIVNVSEQRAAWHTEFRNPNPCDIVRESLAEIKKISEKIRKKQWFFEVMDVVNIGIGGSDLGPKLICEAFSDDEKIPRVHFVSNLDQAKIQTVLKKLNPEKTLFIATSKSFRTIEMIENLKIAKKWLHDAGCDSEKQFIAVTNNRDEAIQVYHIPAEQVLLMPDWMGGRYSIWCAIGISCAIVLGFEAFYALHQGAHEMDQHFFQADIADNKPLQYALMLHHAIMQCDQKTLAILPYAHPLRTLPDYLQQLFMESLGKNVTTDGKKVQYATGPIVFGGVGTNSQHSFQQLMMQGTHPIFADFILPLSQANVVANCLSQVKTLREGVISENSLKHISGSKIANLLVLEKLDLKTLGALLAFYEHAVVTLGFLLNINPFDQFGVEHAKSESEKLLHAHGDDILKRACVEKLV